MHRDRHETLELFVGGLGQQGLGPDVLVALRVAGKESSHERDERDALELGLALRLDRVFLIAKQRLEPMRVPQRFRGERRHDLAEADVRVREGLGVAIRAEEDRADHRALPSNRHDDDRPHVAHVERRFDALERRIGPRIGDEHRLTGLEGALELRIAIEIHDEVADRRILVAGDESNFVVRAREEDRASVETEGLAELTGDRLQDVDEMERGGDFLQDVDDRDEVVALALQLGYPRAEPGDLVISPIGRRRRRGSLWAGLGRAERRLSVRLIHVRRQDAR